MVGEKASLLLALSSSGLLLQVCVNIESILLFDLNVVVYHVDEQRSTEEALSGEDLVDLLQLRSYGSLVFLLESVHHVLVDSARSGLLPSACVASIYEVGAFLNKARDATGEARDVIQIGLVPSIIIATGASHSPCVALIGLCGNELGLISDRVDLPKAALQLVQHYFYFDILGLVGAKLVPDAHSMESVLAGEDIELSIENGLEAEVAHLARVDRDMLVLLLPLLLPQKLSVLGVVFELLLERVDLVVVVIEAITEVLLHVLDPLIWWE